MYKAYENFLFQNDKYIQKQRAAYIAALSHDLKIPTLAQIRALELIASGELGGLSKEQNEIINLTLDSCKSVYDMLSTILTTYKYENKDVALNMQKIEVSQLLNNCFLKFSKDICYKKLKIKVVSENGPCYLFADEVQIKKAFENLIDYCISLAYANSSVESKINVSDNNIIISFIFDSPNGKKLEELLDEYSSLNFDKIGGGLGLYLTRQVIAAHNGDISFNIKKPEFNICSIKLPSIKDCKIPAFSY